MLKLKRWTRCRWEWCLPATKPINVELQNITLPWRPLLSYHTGADSHDRDMIGVSYHRIVTHLDIRVIFLIPPSWFAHKGTSKRSIRWCIAQNLLLQIATYVHRIINIRLQWRAIVDAERYIWYIRLSCTSLANMVPPHHPMHT